MASKARWQLAWLPEALRGRATLLSRTALGTVATLLVATPSRAQPAANARPSGGIVTAGSASIGTSASTTTITQTTQRTAINWQSFNVGSQQTVDFIQPSSSSVALNRVISSNPSQIAGHIDANGQIILINQSGVIFDQGAQVNSAGLIVSAAGMNNVNFMAGKLVFDQAAHPNAAVVNQGSLTVRQAGLAALVAPQVANSGVITAKLGHVVLAGAKTATLDLYGDGLVSLDVNNQVTQVPTGADGKAATALVTNTGVIQADGGTVQLTAREADGLVQNLVQAGGKISADSVGSKTGTIVLGGLGGSIALSGVVTADGSAPGTTGGRVQVDANHAVTVAAGARVSASGPAGGGTVAIGTTLARAAGGPGTVSSLTARTVQVAQGASIAANATADGNGGRVTVLSSLSTSMSGNIYALDGPRGGNGGFIETSGEWLGIGAGAVIDARALSATGKPGTWLLDPLTLDVVAGGTDTAVNKTAGPPFTVTPNNTPPGTAAKISNGTIDGELNGGTNVVLTTTNTGTGSGEIRVDPGAGITWTSGATLTMNSVGAIIIDAPITNTTNPAAALILNAAGVVGQDPTNGAISVGNLAITSVGAVTLLAANSVTTLAASVSQAGNSFQFNNTAAALTVGTNVGGSVVSGVSTLNGAIDLTTAGSGAITLTGSINAGSAAVALTSAGAITESGGAITAGTLTGSAVGAATLSNAGNAIANLGPFSSVENFTLNDTPTGATPTLTVVGTVLASAGLAPSVLNLTVAGNLVIGPATGTPAGLSGGAVDLTTTANGAATGTISETALGSVTASTLTGSATASVSLPQQNNLVGALAGFTAGSGFVLATAQPLTVTGAVDAGTGALSLASTGSLVVNANLTTSGAEIDLASAAGNSFTNTAAIASGGGNIVVIADAMSLSSAGASIDAGSGVVVLGPATPSDSVVLGAASTGNTLGLQTTDLATITAGMVQIGYAAPNGTASFTGAISIGGTGGISIDPATIPALLLLTGGAVSQTQPLVFSAAGGTLGVIAGGNVILGGAGNAVDTIAGFAGNSGNFTFVNGQALTVGSMPAQQLGVPVANFTNWLVSSAPLATGTGLPGNALTGVTTYGVTVGNPTPGVIVLRTTAGDLALDAPVNANNGSTSLVAAPNLVGLEAFGNITQTAAGVISASGVEALAGGSVTLDAAPNQIDNFGLNGQPGQVAGTSTGSFALLDSGHVLATGILAVSAGVTLTIATGVVTSNADIDLASAGLALNQPLNAGGGTVRLVESGAVSQQSAGIITAGSLSVTDSGGQVVLEALNVINTVVASLTSGGSAFSLQDVGTLLTIGSVAAAPLADDPNSVFGAVTGATTNGGDINLASGGLAVNAAVAAGAGTVRLVEFGAVTQAPGSSITAGALSVTDSGGQVVLEAANAIGTLAVNVTFAGGALSFSNGTTAVTVGSVVAAGAGADPGGVFHAVAGLTTSDADINLLSGGLTLGNAVNAGAGTVRLLESGAVSQAPGGVITAGSLAVTDSGGPVVLEAANAVGLVAADVTFAGGAFSFNDPATPLIIGSVGGAAGGEDPAILFASTVTGATTSNADINLASKGLALNEAVGAGSGTVRLVDTGRLSQLTTGGITAGSLAVTLSGSPAGLGATNAIGTVAANVTFTHGAFSLNDGTTALTVGGVAGAPGGPGSGDPLGLFASAVTGVTTSAGNITLQAAGITLNQAVSAGTANVTLTSAGAISQGASGAITAADLDAETDLDAGGSISLTSPGNKVGKATLSSLNGAGNALSSGAIAFVDGIALTIADLSVLQTGVATIGAVQLADSGAGITVEAGAAVTGSSVEIGVSAANGSFTNDGAVDATVSGVAPVGDVVILANTMSLSGGTISAPDAVVLGPFSTGVGVTLGGAAGGTLSLQANDIASITAGLLQIGYSALTGDIAIAGALSLSAPQVPAMALVTGGKIGEAGGIGVSFAGTGTLALVAGGSVAMQGGNQVSTLAGSAGGLGQSFVFNNLNLPLTVGTFPLALVGVAPDGNNFPVPSAGATPSGVVTANGNITLATATSGDVVLDAPVNAGIGTVALDSVGAITQSAGGIVTAGTLTMSSTGGATLGDTNKVAALGTSTDTSTTGITLVDGEALTVVGAVTAANSATLTLTTTTGGLAIGAVGKVGVLNAGTVALTAAGGISEPNGSVVAGTLTVVTTGAGDVSLGSATNQIGTDAGISVNSGDLVLVDNANLTLTGNQSANNLFFEVNADGGALQLGSNFVGATLSAAAGSNARISLVADNITEGFAPSSIATNGGTGGSGSVEVAPFTGSRAVSLAGATGSDEVIDAGLIGIVTTGTVNVGRYTAVPAGGGLVISAQSIVVAGSFDLTGHAVALGLYSQFGISEPAGEIVVGTLTGSVGEGGVALSANNLVGTLGPFSSFSGFALTDNEALTVVGPVTDSGTGAGVSLTTTTGGITLAGAINAAGDTLTLISAGSISQPGGSIDVATLSGRAATSANLTQAGNLVGAVGGFATAAGLVLIDNEALTVSGPVSDSGVGQTVALTTTTGGITLSGVISAAGDTLDLVSAGAISQSGGSINVGTLTGSAVGSAGLSAAANLVGTLGAFSSAGGFSLTVNQALLVDGPVTDSGTGRTVALTTGVGDLTLAGVISAPRDTLDLVSAGAISQTGGSISVATLTGSAVGSASLTQTGNLVGALAAFGTGSGLTLIDGQALTVSGPVSDSGTGGLVELVTQTGGITLTGVVNAAGDTLELVSAGSINQTGGAIDVATLTGSAVGSASFAQAGNVVGTLASFSTGGGFALVDNAALTVSGPVTDSGTGQTVALTTETGGITLDGAIGAAGDTLALVSAGTIIQPGGSIDVATLRGSAVGSASLTQAANVVVALGSFSTGAGFALVDGQSLVVNGPVTDSGSGQTVALTTEAGDITLAGAINAGGDTLDLVSAGSIAQTGGSVVVATLTGSAVGSASLAQTTNLVGTLAGFSTGGGFALTTNEALTVSGPVTDSGSGATVALTTRAGGLTLAGVIDASGDNLALVSAGSITQPGGSIDVATLSVTAAGSATLTQAGNLVGQLGAISTGGGFTLVDNQGLTVGGVVTDTGTGQTLVLTAGAGGITLNSSIDAPGDTLDLISGGAISQIGGSIAVATLTGSAMGSASLTQAGNLVGALGPFSTTAGFALVDNRALVVNGPLSDSGIGQTVALTTTAGGLALGGAVNAGGDTLDVVSAGAITQTGGSIDVATLTGSALGSASLNQPTNLVGTLSGFSVSGNFGLTDNAALLVTGPLTGSGLAVGLVTKTGGITLSGVIDAPAATLDLVSASSISQSGGSIDVAVLTGSAATSASFTQATNLVGALAAFSTTAGLTLVDNEALTVSGVVSDTGTGQTVALTTETGGITLSGVINAGGDTLDLVSAGAINQTGGSIDVATLTGSAAGGASLTRTTNLVATLGAFTATADFGLTDNEALLVNGPLAVGGAAVGLTTTTGGITLAGAMNASAATFDIVSAGAINQSGGSIDVALLTGSAVGSASLTQAGNLVGVLGRFTTSAGFALVDNGALAVSGAVSDSGTGQTVALTTETGGITLTGAINAAGDTLVLVSTGAISQTGGSIDVATLTGSAATSASLTQATNLVGALGAFSTTTGFALSSNEALVVNGTVSDSGTGQTVALTTNTGDITFASAINAAGDTLDIASGGAINQTGGSIDVATLTGGALTSASLTQTGNLVGTLNGFSTRAGFALVDNEALTVAGTVQDTSAQTVALTTETGGITLTGVLSAASVDLISAGAINQTGGQLDAGVLTGSAVTSASLTQAGNRVGMLRQFSTTAGFALTDSENFVVSGPLTDTGSGQTVALTDLGGGFALAGPINAANDTLDLVATGGISEAGGSINVATLTGSAGSNVLLATSTNLVGTLGAFSSGGGFTLVDNQTLVVVGPLSDTGTGQTVALTTEAGDLTLAGAVVAPNDTLALVSAGAIAQTGGAIDVATLTGSAATSASLTQAGNVVGTLGAFTTSAGFALVDNAALTVTGPLTDTGTGQTVALTTTSGGITLAGNINATNDTIDLVSAASITQTGGVIDPVTLTGSAVGSVSLLEPGNLISTLSTFTAGTSFELADSEGLTLTGVLTAPLIFIDMPGNPLTMAAGAVLITGGTPPPNQLSITAAQIPPIPPPANGVGAYFRSGTFTQLGTDSVTPIAGSANSILFVDVTNGENISFAGLTAPTTWLILGLDARGSKVTGKVDLKSLTVTLPPGSVSSDFSVTLSGTVNGVSGLEAAQESGVIPTKGATLQFNNCPIGTVGCVVLSGVPVPTGSPLQFLTLGILVAPNDESDLLLPLVSDEDYLSCLLRKDCE